MSHFAKIENGIVTNVIVAEQDFIDTLEGTWIQTSYRTRGCTHYDTNIWPPSADGGIALRGNFACIGFTYDDINDVFIPPNPNTTLTRASSSLTANLAPQTYALNNNTFLWVPPKPPHYHSWKFNPFTLSWEPPIPMPTDGFTYTWFESLSGWVKSTAPQTITDITEMTAQELSGLYISIPSLSALNVSHTTLVTLSTVYASDPALTFLTNPKS